MRRLGRGDSAPTAVVARAGLERGERVLADGLAADGTWLLGTRDHVVLVPGSPEPATRLPWERVENADWDRDAERLRIEEVGEFGRVRPVHTFTMTEPRRLLQLIRERVTASVVLSRRVAITGKRGLTVVARRPPRGLGEITWACEYDAGIDPTDPFVAQAAAEGVRDAQDELGPGRGPILR